jgi:hypothetical protein
MPENQTDLIAEDIEETSWDQLVRSMIANDPEEEDGGTPMDSSSNGCCGSACGDAGHCGDL